MFPTIQTRPIIGLEIHVQLATRTKLFCSCPLEFGAEPNSRVCPVCLGMPGVLPVMNELAYEYSVRTALALNCKIAGHTKWDRKSYYYPDLPKNYQISQYDLPLSYDGYLDIPINGGVKRVGIIRAHLEEDAGKNQHEDPRFTQVDLNRTGTPLLEIVTEPDLASADEAYVFCTELQKLVTYLGVSEASMQKGQMRFEPNINVAITADGVEYRTPIVEVKNLNSFRSVREAIAYEIERHIQDWQADHDYTLDKKGKENRGWDDNRGVTEFQRGKEDAHDYRYFPEPDLVPVELSEQRLNELRATVPELPIARRTRFMTEFGLSAEDAEMIVADRTTADLFEEAIDLGSGVKTLCKHFINVWAKFANDRKTTVAGLGVDASRMAELAGLVVDGEISASAATTLAETMLDDPASPGALADRLQLRKVVDTDQTADWVDAAFTANAKAVSDAQSNPKKRNAAAGFLRGQVMKLSKGQADPKLVGELIEKKLDAAGA
jgi:aspartyl-tRNA(Asn)/glutamyl-tRNA(Gln) amidotransferase subunit B